MSKLFKILLASFIALSLFVIPTTNVQAANKVEDVQPYVTVRTVNVDKTYTYTDTQVIDPGNTVQITYRISGSYMLRDNNGVYSVSDVDLYVEIVNVKINGSITTLINAKIGKVSKTVNSRNVTLSFKLQYKLTGDTVYKDLESISKTV